MNILLGGPSLERCIQSMLSQQAAGGIEVIVPVCAATDGAGELRRKYPNVRFVDVGRLPARADASRPRTAHLIYCRRRAAGLAAARGEIVALTEDQVIPDSNWCAAILEAHRGPYAAIGGAVENAREEPLHRALYLFDFGRYQRPFTAGEAVLLTDQNVSYKRAALEKVRHVWADLYHESAVHEALRAAGEKLWITPDSVVRLDRGRLAFGQQLRERFGWGMVFGGERAQRSSTLRRAVLFCLTPLVPALILATRVLPALRKGYSPRRILASLPALSMMACCWAAGEAAGSLAGRPFPAPRPSTVAANKAETIF